MVKCRWLKAKKNDKRDIKPQRDTFRKFGKLIDSYTFKDAIDKIPETIV